MLLLPLSIWLMLLTVFMLLMLQMPLTLLFSAEGGQNEVVSKDIKQILRAVCVRVCVRTPTDGCKQSCKATKVNLQCCGVSEEIYENALCVSVVPPPPSPIATSASSSSCGGDALPPYISQLS